MNRAPRKKKQLKKDEDRLKLDKKLRDVLLSDKRELASSLGIKEGEGAKTDKRIVEKAQGLNSERSLHSDRIQTSEVLDDELPNYKCDNRAINALRNSRKAYQQRLLQLLHQKQELTLLGNQLQATITHLGEQYDTTAGFALPSLVLTKQELVSKLEKQHELITNQINEIYRKYQLLCADISDNKPFSDAMIDSDQNISVDLSKIKDNFGILSDSGDSIIDNDNEISLEKGLVELRDLIRQFEEVFASVCGSEYDAYFSKMDDSIETLVRASQENSPQRSLPSLSPMPFSPIYFPAFVVNTVPTSSPKQFCSDHNCPAKSQFVSQTNSCHVSCAANMSPVVVIERRKCLSDDFRTSVIPSQFRRFSTTTLVPTNVEKYEDRRPARSRRVHHRWQPTKRRSLKQRQFEVVNERNKFDVEQLEDDEEFSDKSAQSDVFVSAASVGMQANKLSNIYNKKRSTLTEVNEAITKAQTLQKTTCAFTEEQHAEANGVESPPVSAEVGVVICMLVLLVGGIVSLAGIAYLFYKVSSRRIQPRGLDLDDDCRRYGFDDLCLQNAPAIVKSPKNSTAVTTAISIFCSRNISIKKSVDSCYDLSSAVHITDVESECERNFVDLEQRIYSYLTNQSNIEVTVGRHLLLSCLDVATLRLSGSKQLRLAITQVVFKEFATNSENVSNIFYVVGRLAREFGLYVFVDIYYVIHHDNVTARFVDIQPLESFFFATWQDDDVLYLVNISNSILNRFVDANILLGFLERLRSFLLRFRHERETPTLTNITDTPLAARMIVQGFYYELEQQHRAYIINKNFFESLDLFLANEEASSIVEFLVICLIAHLSLFLPDDARLFRLSTSDRRTYSRLGECVHFVNRVFPFDVAPQPDKNEAVSLAHSVNPMLFVPNSTLMLSEEDTQALSKLFGGFKLDVPTVNISSFIPLLHPRSLITSYRKIHRRVVLESVRFSALDDVGVKGDRTRDIIWIYGAGGTHNGQCQRLGKLWAISGILARAVVSRLTLFTSTLSDALATLSTCLSTNWKRRHFSQNDVARRVTGDDLVVEFLQLLQLEQLWPQLRETQSDDVFYYRLMATATKCDAFYSLQKKKILAFLSRYSRRFRRQFRCDDNMVQDEALCELHF